MTAPTPICAPPTRKRLAAAVASVDPAEAGRIWLKRLVWLYAALLLGEGALRKWVLPQFSGPLLVVRDPLVLLIYFLAAKHRLFPRGGFASALFALLVGSVFLGVLQVILLDLPASVVAFGLRTNFLHLPLILLLPALLTAEDMRRMGKWTLLAAVPMALLMAYQFKSPADAWINRAPGLSGGKQLVAALGKVRPPGTFSFITGPVSFFGLAAAFLVFGMKRGKELYPRALLAAAVLAVGLAMAVSGSRSLIISVGIVLVAWLLGIVAARKVEADVTRVLLLSVIALVVLAQVQLFREGTEVLSTRWEMASAAEQTEGGMIGRALNSVLVPWRIITSVSLFGQGLGVGTNVGATLLTGQAQFLLSEEEWGRVVLEMGPVLGMLFIAFRVCLALWLARRSILCAMTGQVLPLLLFGACAANLVTGQISQPTTLGFMVLGTGLCLTAIQTTPVPEALRKGRGKFKAQSSKFKKSPTCQDPSSKARFPVRP